MMVGTEGVKNAMITSNTPLPGTADREIVLRLTFFFAVWRVSVVGL